METKIQLSPNEPSICIPRMFSSVTKETVLNVINTFALGKIKSIDIIKIKCEGGNSESYQKVFIHFDTWNSNKTAKQVRDMLLTGEEVKIIYDSPWFWKLFANKSQKN